MNRTQTERMLAWFEDNKKAMLAYADGKEVECSGDGELWFPSNSAVGPVWFTLSNGNFCYSARYYREKVEKKLRPYTYDELSGILNRAVKSKDGRIVLTILGARVGSECTSSPVVLFIDYSRTAETLLEQFTWLDGSPCGVFE